MHIYAFGSVCRGDVSLGSDVDLLAIVDGHDPRFSPEDYSIYSYNRLRELWAEGNPFAWHLSLEAKLLHASDQLDFLRSLGHPVRYTNGRRDCEKFLALFHEAINSVKTQSNCTVFDLSVMFLAIRNFATCFSLAKLPNPDFSRSSALRLGHHSLSLPPECYSAIERSRLLSTRGIGSPVTESEAASVISQIPHVEEWMATLLKEVA